MLTKSMIKLPGPLVCPVDPVGVLTLGPGQFAAMVEVVHFRERWSSGDSSDTLRLTVTVADSRSQTFKLERKVSARTLWGLAANFSRDRQVGRPSKCLSEIAWVLPEGSFLPAFGFEASRGPADVLFVPSTLVASIRMHRRDLMAPPDEENPLIYLRGKAMWPNGEVVDTEAWSLPHGFSRLLFWPSISVGPQVDHSAASPLRAFHGESLGALEAPVRFDS
jgi:hypothetical protein